MRNHKGYVLKYVGDKVIAFFPSSYNKLLACDNAIYCAHSVSTAELAELDVRYVVQSFQLVSWWDPGYSIHMTTSYKSFIIALCSSWEGTIVALSVSFRFLLMRSQKYDTPCLICM